MSFFTFLRTKSIGKGFVIVSINVTGAIDESADFGAASKNWLAPALHSCPSLKPC